MGTQVTTLRNSLQALKAGHVFDGREVRNAGMMLVENGRILDVDFTGATPPAHAVVTDFGPDSWMLPGLVDAHVHLSWDAGEDAVSHVAADDFDTVVGTARNSAAMALRTGVTTVRDLGDRDYAVLKLREQTPEAALPEIVAAGPPITAPGGHCHFLRGVAEGVDELRRAVKQRAKRGCDVVKVMASGGNMTPGSNPLRQQYSRAELQAVVEEAHGLGLTAAAHVHSAEAIGDVIDAGFDTIEHFTFFTADGARLRPELLDQVVKQRIFVSLTLGMLPGSPPPPALAPRIEALTRVVEQVVSSGARIVLGTDAGIEPAKPHDIFPHAMTHLAELGMSALDVLRSATSEGAGAVGLNGRKGVLRAGADADVLVVGRSPVADLSSMTDVRAVYRAGSRVISVEA